MKSSCLKSACECVNTDIYKKCFNKFFKQFFKKQIFKKSHLSTTEGGPLDPKPHFLGSELPLLLFKKFPRRF